MSIRRRLFKGACGPLLAMCALVGVLWAGSYRSIALAKMPVSAGGTRWELTSYRGVLAIAVTDDFPMDALAHARAYPDNDEIAAAWDERYWTAALAGLAFDDTQVWIQDLEGGLVARRWTALNLPYWLLLSIALLGPLHGVYACCRAYRRTTHNQCADCGYDLGDGEICQACAARAMIVGATSRMHLVR
jgi:hypothetical protein